MSLFRWCPDHVHDKKRDVVPSFTLCNFFVSNIPSHIKEIADFVLNSKRLIYITIRVIWISTFSGTCSVKVFSFLTITIWKVKYFEYLSRVTDSSPLLFIQEINLASSRFRSSFHICATSRRCQNERSRLSTLISEVQIMYGYWFQLFLKYLFLSFSYRKNHHLVRSMKILFFCWPHCRIAVRFLYEISFHSRSFNVKLQLSCSCRFLFGRRDKGSEWKKYRMDVCTSKKYRLKPSNVN